MTINEHATHVGDNRIHVTSFTPDEPSQATPLVLVHGSWGGAWMFKNYARSFAKQGFTVHTLSLRGHGESGGTIAGTTMDDYENDVASVINGLDIKNPVVIGHSMGGLVVLMVARDHDVSGVVAIDPSPSAEVQGPGEEKEYKDEYTPVDAGMPTNLEEAMQALPDLSQELLMTLREKLGMESGQARSQRKLGVSIPKESLDIPTLFVGGEHGESVPFGIGIEKARAMTEYYNTEVIEVHGATHPGILIGEHWQSGAEQIHNWITTTVATN